MPFSDTTEYAPTIKPTFRLPHEREAAFNRAHEAWRARGGAWGKHKFADSPEGKQFYATFGSGNDAPQDAPAHEQYAAPPVAGGQPVNPMAGAPAEYQKSVASSFIQAPKPSAPASFVPAARPAPTNAGFIPTAESRKAIEDNNARYQQTQEAFRGLMPKLAQSEPVKPMPAAAPDAARGPSMFSPTTPGMSFDQQKAQAIADMNAALPAQKPATAPATAAKPSMIPSPKAQATGFLPARQPAARPAGDIQRDLAQVSSQAQGMGTVDEATSRRLMDLEREQTAATPAQPSQFARGENEHTAAAKQAFADYQKKQEAERQATIAKNRQYDADLAEAQRRGISTRKLYQEREQERLAGEGRKHELALGEQSVQRAAQAGVGAAKAHAAGQGAVAKEQGAAARDVAKTEADSRTDVAKIAKEVASIQTAADLQKFHEQLASQGPEMQAKVEHWKALTAGLPYQQQIELNKSLVEAGLFREKVEGSREDRAARLEGIESSKEARAAMREDKANRTKMQAFQMVDEHFARKHPGLKATEDGGMVDSQGNTIDPQTVAKWRADARKEVMDYLANS